jgi:membrane dipeptidase
MTRPFIVRWRTCLLIGASLAATTVGTQPDDAALRRARAILRTTPLIDTHNDLPWVIRENGKPPRDVVAYDLDAHTAGDTDIARLRAGGVGGQFWSVYVPSEPDAGARGFARIQVEQIDIALRVIERYPRDLALALTADDIERANAEGRIASLLGMEGGHAIENSLGALRVYYRLGVRYMTLTHFNTVDWADAATDSARHNGLTPFGREVVREMNRLGMMVDIAHVSPATMSDVLASTEAPVIFSHAAARGVTDHARNVPDFILRQLPRNGGIVMVAFIPTFVSDSVRHWMDELFPLLTQAASDSQWQRVTREYVARKGPSPRATIKDVADHIEHIKTVAGVDHIGIGADFYGAEAEHELVKGLEDVSKYPALFAELVRRGWSDADLRKLAGENLLRVFRRVEVVGAQLRRTRGPSNATIEERDRRTVP